MAGRLFHHKHIPFRYDVHRAHALHRSIHPGWNLLLCGGNAHGGFPYYSWLVHVPAQHRILSQALKQAVTWGLLETNPCSAVKPPRFDRREMKVLDVNQTATLVEYARRQPRMFMPVLLSAFCGLRRGEVAALRWRSVNLDAGQPAVVASTEQTKDGLREKPPKSGKSRTVALPAIAVEELRRHRISQAEGLLRLGIRQTDATHVCLREDASTW